MGFLDKIGVTYLATRLRKYFATKGYVSEAVDHVVSIMPTKTSELSNDTGFLTSSTGVTSVNGQHGAVTVEGGLEPLIGSAWQIGPDQVLDAILEGRTVCINYNETFDNVDYDLEFTNFNYVDDITNQGQTKNVVVAQTVTYDTTYGFIVWVMTGDILNNRWGTSVSVIPVSGSNISSFNNDVGYVTSDTKVTQTVTSTTDYTYWRGLCVGSSSSQAETGLLSTTTDQVRIFSNIRVQPSTGTLKATTFKGQLSGTIASSTTATTQASTDNSTKVATTAFVKSVLPAGLPSVSSSDNGKVLMVVNGAWAAASLPVYNGGVI